jgi:hypothetical protein
MLNYPDIIKAPITPGKRIWLEEKTNFFNKNQIWDFIIA